jgi:hypothetical protein
MTERTRKLIDELEAELETLPEKEQERRVTSYLQDLRRRKQQSEQRASNQGEDTLYEPFRIMLESDLDLPSNYSEMYEEHLYGDKKHRD